MIIFKGGFVKHLKQKSLEKSRLFDQWEKICFFFSLLSLIFYPEKSRERVREK